MSRVKAARWSAMIVTAAALVGAASASAELPEVGRCLKVLSGGHYKSGSCVTPAMVTEDHWEWYPPGVNARFEGVLDKASGFETVGGTKIYCTDQIIEGKWTVPRTASVEVIRFFPCNLVLNPATEPSVGPFCMEDGAGNVVDSAIRREETVETLPPLEAELGFINKEGLTPKVGFEIKSPAPRNRPCSPSSAVDRSVRRCGCRRHGSSKVTSSAKSNR
jgi:hypothetical protein